MAKRECSCREALIEKHEKAAEALLDRLIKRAGAEQPSQLKDLAQAAAVLIDKANSLRHAPVQETLLFADRGWIQPQDAMSKIEQQSGERTRPNGR